MDPTNDTAPETPDQPNAPEPEAPDSSGSITTPNIGTSVEETIAPFNISDVPEDYREYVEAYNKQTHAAFSRKTAELATARKEWESEREGFIEAHTNWEALQSDPEYQRQVLEQLSEILAEDDAEDDDDLSPAALARIEALESRLAREDEDREFQGQQEAEFEHLSQQMAKIEKDAGRELDENELRILTSYAIANPDADGMPDMNAAWTVYQAVQSRDKTAYRQSKIAPTAPSGVAVTNDQIPNTPEARIQQMAEIISAES